MRCKNCGWPNQPGETECRKCHAPLDPNAAEEPAMAPEAPITDQISNLKKTVLEAPMPGMAAAAPAPQPTVQQPVASNVCPQCGFPLRPGSEKCPKCGLMLNGQPQQPVGRRATVLNNPEQPAAQGNNYVKGVSFKNMNGNMKTVNPFLDGFDAISACSLKPLKRSNERKEPEVQEFEGENIALNRANTDPENVTIATDTQAVITKEGDRWFIEDKSGARTTFVRAGEKVEISDGTIILLGNRLFEFHVQ
ncbi:MAG: zinc ribbon domain-containing protein [Bacteroidales bacterium]|nr:zinc ribbon domain-containing protein [Bacteroidales bacterium]